jgi:hydrogenase expression/formation protein HypC
MCLAVPMRLVAMDGAEGRAEVQGVGRGVRLDLVPDARLGDWLIVHAGYAIEILDEAEAAETMAMVAVALQEGPPSEV